MEASEIWVYACPHQHLLGVPWQVSIVVFVVMCFLFPVFFFFLLLPGQDPVVGLRAPVTVGGGGGAGSRGDRSAAVALLRRGVVLLPHRGRHLARGAEDAINQRRQLLGLREGRGVSRTAQGQRAQRDDQGLGFRESLGCQSRGRVCLGHRRHGLLLLQLEHRLLVDRRRRLNLPLLLLLLVLRAGRRLGQNSRFDHQGPHDVYVFLPWTKMRQKGQKGEGEGSQGGARAYEGQRAVA
jgi:hypothetical protein